jgi:hypothetical protein
MGDDNIKSKGNAGGYNKDIHMFTEKRRLNGYQTNIDSCNSLIKNGYCKGKMESCNVDINKLPDNHRQLQQLNNK